MADLITPEFIPVVKRGTKEWKCHRHGRSPWWQVPCTRNEPCLRHSLCWCTAGPL